VDDTPNIRTCLVHRKDVSAVENIQVDILKQTVADLTAYICKEFFLKPPQRIRNLTANRFYNKEDEGKLLKEFEQFREGGARVQIEEGRCCSEGEISFSVELQRAKDDKAKDNKDADGKPEEDKEESKVFYFDK